MKTTHWAEWMARKVGPTLQTSTPPNEAVLGEMFHECIDHVLQEENRDFLKELIDLAMHEQDSDRRTAYFKIARLIQGRMSKEPENRRRLVATL